LTRGARNKSTRRRRGLGRRCGAWTLSCLWCLFPHENGKGIVAVAVVVVVVVVIVVVWHG
jgi:ATP/ADP translocase